MNVMDEFNKRLRVQESFTSEQRVLDRAQEMAEVQNHIGHWNKDVPPMTDQLIVGNCKREVLEEIALDQEEYTMVQYMNRKNGPSLEPLAK